MTNDPRAEQELAAVISEIICDVCELPGDADPNDPEYVCMTVDDLRIILERRLMSDPQPEIVLTEAMREIVSREMGEGYAVDDHPAMEVALWSYRLAVLQKSRVFSNFLLVPREPTHDMCAAAAEVIVDNGRSAGTTLSCSEAAAIWAAMTTAAVSVEGVTTSPENAGNIVYRGEEWVPLTAYREAVAGRKLLARKLAKYGDRTSKEGDR